MSKRQKRQPRVKITQINQVTQPQIDELRRIVDDDPLIRDLDIEGIGWGAAVPYPEDDCPICKAMREWERDNLN